MADGPQHTAENVEGYVEIDEPLNSPPADLLAAYMLLDGYTGAEVQAYLDQAFSKPTEAEFAAVVERVMCDEGWVCNPADHEDVPEPGECIDCDGDRHRFGYRLHAAMSTPPGAPQ